VRRRKIQEAAGRFGKMVAATDHFCSPPVMGGLDFPWGFQSRVLLAPEGHSGSYTDFANFIMHFRVNGITAAAVSMPSSRPP
jgi:hypothetical protein